MIFQYPKYHVLFEVKQIEKIYEKNSHINIYIDAFIYKIRNFFED